MFISDHHHPQLLPAETYSCLDRYELEFERLFATGWHAVGTVADIPSKGDYFTLRLGNHPIIVRNFGTEVHAFLNVCSHRYCEISSEKSGHSDTFKCQYHGWEYGVDGNTCKIPDAPSFKPLKLGMLGLTRYRTATCGQLIFISLAENGPSLREQLGSSYDTYESLFGNEFEQILSVDMECEANWKIGVENGLESYHVDCVHAGTFGKTPAAEDCHHEMADSYTIFRTPSSVPGTWSHRLENIIARGRGQQATHEYMNLRTYPSMTCSSTDTVTFIQSILPLGPARSVCVYRLFAPQLRTKAWTDRIIAWWTRPQLKKYWQAVFDEDQAILPKIQQGISAPSMPNGGVVSVREERIFHFQDYVVKACEIAAADGSKRIVTQE